MNFEERVTILAHVGWGMALTLVLGLWLNAITAAGATLIFAAGKESIESIWGAWDAKQPWLGALDDTGEFAVGIALALGMLYLRHR